MNQASTKLLQILNWAFFMVMIGVNYLSNALPINGKTAGQLSDQYPNLFVPAPVTFAIWGVIYALLLAFCVKQSKSLFNKVTDLTTANVVREVGVRFIVACFLNMLWLLSWHYEYLLFSVFVMVLYLAQLINLNLRINRVAPSLSTGSRFIVKAAFGIHLGWICIATIANVTAALVYFGWDGWGQSATFWASIMALAGALIAGLALNKLKNGYLGVAVLWAFVGILIARIGATEYHRFVVWSVVFSMGIVALFLLVEITRSLFRKSEIVQPPPVIEATPAGQ